MNFSPEYLSALIVRPLRYLFQHNAPDELKWNKDPKLTGIEIDTINNFNKVAIQQKPRVLISRGQYRIQPVGLSDNLAEGKGLWASRGHRESIRKFFISGNGQILIQARNEGTCERVVNLVQHFLSWTGPMLADSYGFKTTFVPMDVSACTLYQEDSEIFSTTINIPWTKEEHWTVKAADEIKIKAVLASVVIDGFTAPPAPIPLPPPPPPPSAHSFPVPIPSTFTYPENRTTSTLLGQIPLAPGSAAAVSWSFDPNTTVATSADGYYRIDSTGSVFLTATGATGAANDFETTPNSFNYTVYARSSSGDRSDPVALGLIITDIDEILPVIPTGQVFNYFENQTLGAALGTVQATDNVLINGFRFANTGTNVSSNGYYQISNTGVITLTATGLAGEANDFETGLNTFTLTVQASDPTGNWSAPVSVTMNVLDVSDTDLQRSNIILLLPLNGTNNSTTITDYSPTPKTVLAFGDAKISTAFSKWDGSSLYLDGNGDYLKVSGITNFSFMHSTTGVWTYEEWIKFNSFTNTFEIFTTGQGTSGCGVNVHVNTSRQVRVEILQAQTFSPALDGFFPTALPSDTTSFHHFAITCDMTAATNTVNLWYDGVSLGSMTKTGAGFNDVPSSELRIGGFFISGAEHALRDSYSNGVRITKDVIRYTAPFTPPSAPWPLA